MLSDKELQEFKEILLNRKEQILKNINANTKEIDSLKDAEASDEADHASLSADAAIEEALTMKQEAEIKEIDYALFKIENKTYGICEMCEEDIGLARLKVKPQAKYCIVCREITEKRVG
ncbi:MAG: RNA polymerase-binding protein DksA [Sulfurospirillum sp.]|nr:MAG: RNA polymerase-binding protein DksA [Sulfurospirillum sp.]